MTLAPGVQAEERVCRGNLGNRTVDNVRVPENATCTMNGTTVQGTLKVENGATLKATDIRVIGNIQGENHKQVTVRSSHVGGSIQLNQGGGAVITGNRIVLTLYFDSNNRQISARNNNIGDNLQAFQNKERRHGLTKGSSQPDGAGLSGPVPLP